MSLLIEALDLLIAEKLIQTDMRRQRYHGMFHGPSSKEKGPGMGMFSKVRDHKADPHLVKKHNYKPMGEDQLYSDDGFAVFVRYLDSMDMMDNPHFPKVYRANKVVDKSDSHINSFDVEKLVEANTLSLAEFEAVVNTHFDNFEHSTYLEPADKHNQDPDEENDLDQRQAIKWGISEILQKCVENQALIDKFVKLDSLKEALNALVFIIKRTKGKLDIGNKGNYMFRRSPTGLMLVITDPISVV